MQRGGKAGRGTGTPGCCMLLRAATAATALTDGQGEKVSAEAQKKQ